MARLSFYFQYFVVVTVSKSVVPVSGISRTPSIEGLVRDYDEEVGAGNGESSESDVAGVPPSTSPTPSPSPTPETEPMDDDRHQVSISEKFCFYLGQF